MAKLGFFVASRIRGAPVALIFVLVISGDGDWTIG